eukprot:3446342-Lingulodinium_polyedra.AAC.1
MARCRVPARAACHRPSDCWIEARRGRCHAERGAAVGKNKSQQRWSPTAVATPAVATTSASHGSSIGSDSSTVSASVGAASNSGAR